MIPYQFIMDEAEAEYGLVMPFVVVTSVGGPYDDAAFAAGWQCGALLERLTRLASLDVQEYTEAVRSDMVDQVDLIAMHTGYLFEAHPSDDPTWTYATFTRPNG